jgi:hypothetical protein
MGYDAIVEALLGAGASAGVRDAAGRTPVELARRRALTSTVALLAPSQ